MAAGEGSDASGDAVPTAELIGWVAADGLPDPWADGVSSIDAVAPSEPVGLDNAPVDGDAPEEDRTNEIAIKVPSRATRTINATPTLRRPMARRSGMDPLSRSIRPMLETTPWGSRGVVGPLSQAWLGWAGGAHEPSGPRASPALTQALLADPACRSTRHGLRRAHASAIADRRPIATTQPDGASAESRRRRQPRARRVASRRRPSSTTVRERAAQRSWP